MESITKSEIDLLLDQVVQDLKLENIKTRDNLISYIVRVYGDQSYYRRYIPIGFYTSVVLYFFGLSFLIFLGINGGLASDDAIRKGFHSLWVASANVMYFFSFCLICISIYSLLVSRDTFRIPYKRIFLVVFIIPITWWIGVVLGSIIN